MIIIKFLLIRTDAKHRVTFPLNLIIFHSKFSLKKLKFMHLLSFLLSLFIIIIISVIIITFIIITVIIFTVVISNVIVFILITYVLSFWWSVVNMP